MERALQEQGFDLCYDKRLYDRLAHDSPESVREHLQADAPYQDGLIGFIENHDEPRAAATFGAAQARAAAVVMSTLPGARLYHDGQLEGRRKRIPIQLARGPDEPTDSDLRPLYGRLLRAVSDAGLRKRQVALVRVRRLAGQRVPPPARFLMLVRIGRTPPCGGQPVQLRRRKPACVFPWADLAEGTWKLTERLTGRRFRRARDERVGAGLYAALDPWASKFLALAP